ncbi:hypothetical protein ACA910_000540 [Epithemia clementina (nom. ined.)]
MSSNNRGGAGRPAGAAPPGSYYGQAPTAPHPPYYPTTSAPPPQGPYAPVGGGGGGGGGGGAAYYGAPPSSAARAGGYPPSTTMATPPPSYGGGVVGGPHYHHHHGAPPPQQQQQQQVPPGPQRPPYPPPPQQPQPQHPPQQQQQQQQQLSQQQPTPNQVAFLQNQGFPSGMIQAVWHLKNVFPLRIWILDNSSYMIVRDAHIIKPDYQQINDVTRWEELRECLTYHTDFYTAFAMPTRFALLNPPPPSSTPGIIVAIPQYFSLMQTGHLALEQEVLGQVVRTLQPHGPTPMTAQLNILHQYIASIDAGLRARRHTVSIVLATQGLPTNDKGESSPQIIQEFIETIRRLESLSVWIVIRLCSDDEKTFEFYNSLDSQDNLDALDDFYGEAVEVYLRNPWLCYALVLHRFRETGFRYHVGTLDAIDERALTLAELRDLGQFLFGVATMPDPSVDWNGFLRALETCMARERPHWNPILRKVTPWIDIGLLNAIYTRPPPQQQQRPYQQPPTPQAAPPGAVPPTGSSTVGGVPRPTPQPQYPSSSSSATPNTNAGSPSPSATPSQPSQTPAASTTTGDDLKNAIEQKWSKEPPNFMQVKDIASLLGTIHMTFDLVEPHEYFSKFHPFSRDALNGNDMAVLKRAVRKTRLFIHPDKLPKDLNDNQQTLCRVLWDTVSDSWNQKEQQ